MRISHAALALVAVAASPSAAEPQNLPRLWLSSHTPRHADKLVVRGTQCPWSGLGSGYGVWLFDNGRKNLDEWPEAGEDGRWEAAFLPVDIPAGRYRLAATCFKGQHPNDPKYPEETVTLLPHADADGALTVSDATVHPGQVLTVSGSGFTEAAPTSFRVGVFWGSTYLASLDVDRTVSGSVAVPPDAAPGRYRLLMEGRAYPSKNQTLWTLATYVTIPAPTPSPPSPSRSASPSPTPTPEPKTPAPTSATNTSPPATTEPPLVELVAGGDDGLPVGAVAGLGLGAASSAAAAFALVRRRRAAR